MEGKRSAGFNLGKPKTLPKYGDYTKSQSFSAGPSAYQSLGQVVASSEHAVLPSKMVGK